jgi:hypothetical protein
VTDAEDAEVKANHRLTREPARKVFIEHKAQLVQVIFGLLVILLLSADNEAGETKTIGWIETDVGV